MLEAIMSTLGIMGWLGVILGILVIVNTVCGTVTNITNGESFSWKKMLKGLAKAAIFYGSAICTSVAFTMLPYINEMIVNSFGVILLSTELLNTLSSVAVLGIVVSTVVVQAKKAIEGLIKLANISVGEEKITWEVIEEEEDK